MPGPLTPHLRITPHSDGVHVWFKGAELVLPAEQAKAFAQQMIEAADAHDPLGVSPLPEVKLKT